MKNKETCPYCFELLKNCICIFHNCSICGERLPESELYEYRGAYACEKDIDKATERRDMERANIIEENKAKTDRFRGLDMGDSAIGKANREILKRDIEIAKKESLQTKKYEGRE